MRELATPLYSSSDSAHDIGHALRVLGLAERIAKAERADLSIVKPAALLHDIGCAPKHLGKERESEGRTLDISKGLLKEAGYGPDDTRAILSIIEVHGFSRGIVPTTLEGRVLQDADRLDAMGAVGIARTFLVGGSTNRPIYHLEDPWARARKVDDKAYNLDHFFRKLLTLRDGMHTNTGRRLAERRHRFLERYLKELKAELSK